MRKVRSRLTILLYLLVIGSSLFSLLLAALVRNGVILRRDTVRYLLFGYAAKDVFLLVVAVAAVVVVVMITSRSTTNPIRDLNRAVKEVAAGNFGARVDIRDRVEEYGELQRNFNLMAEELQANEYLRKDFISNVSHELKTPLSIMNGYAHLLAEGGLTEEETREYARLIEEESGRLTDLTGNMLRLSRIDNRHLTPKAETFALGEQLRQVILRLEPRWTAARLEMDPDIQDVDYTGDQELLGQVWENLLGNAIKFTPAGGKVSVTLREEADRVTVAVADTGIGMDSATLGRIFEQFFRGETEHKREGSGLGLPLSKRIAELHGGTITAESAPGRGSVFTVALPKKES